MVCVALLAVCCLLPWSYGIVFDEFCDRIDEPRLAEALCFAPFS